MDKLIEFRGQRVDRMGWVYGYFLPNYYIKAHNHYNKNITGNIRAYDSQDVWSDYEIIPETLGQCTRIFTIHDTGSYDERIFEGDIVEYCLKNETENRIVVITDINDVDENLKNSDLLRWSKIIGNIVDNPNLCMI